MRVLLDESLPRPPAPLLTGHDVRTVAQAGWTSFDNGELLRLAATAFDVLVTADQNLEFQQQQLDLRRHVRRARLASRRACYR